MEDNEKLERNLKLLEKKMHAKKAILKEVLRTVETEKDRVGSSKSRKYIKDVSSTWIDKFYLDSDAELPNFDPSD